MEVFFDDLKVVHHYSDIVGGSDYYPFGLEINDRRIVREKHCIKQDEIFFAFAGWILCIGKNKIVDFATYLHRSGDRGRVLQIEVV